MKYIVYLTTNTKSSIGKTPKIYIGVHQTKDPEIFDGYIGCGVYVNQPSTYMYPKTPFQCAVKKYGVEAFRRVVLYVYNTAKEAYEKESELVNLDFIKQDHTYNVCLGGGGIKLVYQPIYQFDLQGKLKKKWDFLEEVSDFYGIGKWRIPYAIHDKHSFLESYWSHDKFIDLKNFRNTPHGSPAPTYLYSLGGKCIMVFPSRKQLSEYLGMDPASINTAIRRQRVVQKKYYISDKLVDEFIPKPRAQYLNSTFYVYKETGELIGSYIGKKVMPVIGMHSWSRIRDIMVDNKGWYKTFYISETSVNKLPERQQWHRVKIDVYDKYGNFIETSESVKEVREKYNVPACRIKNIQQGSKYYKDWIFKYHSA